MGYEVVFHCHEKKAEGIGYNVETTKTFKKVVGKATEDTPLEQLAKLVFGSVTVTLIETIQMPFSIFRRCWLLGFQGTSA